jgi:NAD(P)-dependent dehydrogenase (short-subunit alcohol dehydrogenase family)
VTCDASKEADVARMVEAGVQAFGKLTTLVNNAGDGGPTRPVEDYTMDDWLYTIHSCLTSSYVCTRYAVPPMVKAGGGAIVNVSSSAGRRGLAYRIGYCSAKAGQIGMTYGMALELGPRGIRVNCVAPGAVEGDRIDRVIAGQAEVRGTSVEAMRAKFLERSPLRRMTTAEDIAEAVAFLASDRAKNISGQVLSVNAGEPGA